MNTTYPNVKKVIGELIKMGCVPILSHPERYKEYQKHPEKLVELTEMGVLLQGNYKSLLGKNGTVACKTIKTLLKKGLITFLGSDTHHLESYDIKSARKAVKKIVLSDDIVEDLFCNNFDKVINDLDIN